MYLRRSFYHALVVLASLAVPSRLCAQGIITTVAGNPWIFEDSIKQAKSARLGFLRQVTVDSTGNLYVADFGNSVVVKITADGTLTTAAGNGIAGFSGEGDTATGASLDSPQGVAVDASGNIYIADYDNNRIRKITSSGAIITVAGTGAAAFSGDGGPALAASMNGPNSLAFDSTGNLYIADTFNHRIRKLAPGGRITTVAGNGNAAYSGDGGQAASASLQYPSGIAFDHLGNLYIADSYNFRIRKVSSDGTITTVAGNGQAGFSGDGGPATAASLQFPSGLVFDLAGNLYIADTDNNRIRKVTPGGTITTVAGNGTYGFSGDGASATSATLASPSGVSVDTLGNVYIADTFNYRLRELKPDGTIVTVAGNGSYKYGGDGGPAALAYLNSPHGLALTAAGEIYIGDTENNRIRKVSLDGTIKTVAGTGQLGFSGDGSSATNAMLHAPVGVAVDASGNLYIVDSGNFRIRVVTPSGIIATLAGNGLYGFSGDGGPATGAMLANPLGIAVDPLGNIYIADSDNNRIRKITPAGTISTIAGNGAAGYSGDGGPATKASLNAPTGVAVDSSGNVYVSDMGNNRIRRINTSGVITSVAGNGAADYSGDGGPATSAALNQPFGVTVDLAGNLYVSDTQNGRVRGINPAGIISTLAGGGEGGDGGPAIGAQTTPKGVAVDSNGNLFIADFDSDQIREVLLNSFSTASFTLSASSLGFSASAGGGVVLPQQVNVSGVISGLAWSASVSTQSGGDWLSASPTSGAVPGLITVTVDATSLQPGNYQGTLKVQSPSATPPVRSISVSLAVQPAAPPQLSIEPKKLSLDAFVGAVTQPSHTLRIGNAGSGTLNWTARTTTTSGGDWLGVSSASGTASFSSPSSVQITADISNLAAGAYSGTVIVQSSTTSSTQRLGVTLLVSPANQTILLSHTGLTFTAVEAGVAPRSETFSIINTGQGNMNWATQATALSGGSWLSVSPATGTSVADSLRIPAVRVAVNTAGLTAGQYDGLIRVLAPGATDSPQSLSVKLNVLPAGTNPGVQVRPTGLIFSAEAGTSSPASQTVSLDTIIPGVVQVVSGLITRGGSTWAKAVPPKVTLRNDQSTGKITVQPILGTLGPGTYRGELTLQFNDGSPTQVVDLVFVVTKSVVTSSAATGREAGPLSEGGVLPAAGTSCVPQHLLAVQQSLGNNFASPVGWPSTIEVEVVDDCGNPVPNAAVIGSFTNGDPPLVLNSLGNGLYAGTWNPVNTVGQVTVTVRATLPPLAPAQVQAQGQVQANPAAPFVSSGGIVNAASFVLGEALAPGSIVSVFGRNLGASQALASGVPLPTVLSGASMNVGGIDAPLFYGSDGQINAQLPFEVAANSRPAVVVRVRKDPNGLQTVTVPEIITTAAARPAIFTTNQQGTGQGDILDVRGRLVDSSAPASAGNTVEVFATGLGTTLPAVPSGQSAPAAEPLARVVASVTAQVGGINATVQFAGLAPNFVGLYQVNVEIPSGVTPGPDVPLVLFQNGVASNIATLAIH